MRLLLAGGLALAVFTAACGDNAVAPKSPADPQATASELAALVSLFNAPALQSLSSVQITVPTSAPAPVHALALAAATNPLHHSTRLEPYARRIDAARVFAGLLSENSTSSTAALLPPAYVGKTFEWDFTNHLYDTTARAGAPSNGVRFILYAIDPLTLEPAGPAPGTEVGYIDLKDESGSTPKVHVTVAGVGGTPVYVDYTVTLTSQSGTSVKISTSGYITNGADSPDSLRFGGAISAAVSGTSSTTTVTVTEDVSFDVNSQDIHVRNWQRLTLTETSSQTSVSIRLSFRFDHAGEVVTLDGSLNATSVGDVSGTVTAKVDGGLYATCSVTGTSNSYTLTCQGADADGLSADDNAALDALGNAAGNVTAVFEGLLGPSLGVLGA
ncbi:MAG TPA: hypothetical protein VG454_12780 [Gemmatimonadales bacterium]|nr:hypothetical protein [Gemmatimonadales bacterium]